MLTEIATCGSSPHTRGAPRRRAARSPGERIIPAYAGSTWRRTGTPPRRRDHPRIRGEHPDAERHDPRGDGSSPHTRGAPQACTPSTRRRRIIPAYAGSTTETCIRPAATWDHPRIRGEHIGAAAHQIKITGSSPHTRGARDPEWRPGRGRGIIPAYAGSTRSEEQLRPGGADHPRIRGEHRHQRMPDEQYRGSSPHTRGARLYGEPLQIAWRIIPAYAGSTIPKARSRGSMPDHPRIRGEHEAELTGIGGPAGSSPHTRGARKPRVRFCGGSWIIPAYAGST